MAIMPQSPTADPSVSRQQLDSYSGEDDRRSDDRIEQDMPARLVEWGGGDPIDCVIRNVGIGGAFVTTGGKIDLCVGQRYEIFLDKDNCPRGLADAFTEGCYVTVIRTQVTPDEDAGRGAGVRFDQPLML